MVGRQPMLIHRLAPVNSVFAVCSTTLALGVSEIWLAVQLSKPVYKKKIKSNESMQWQSQEVSIYFPSSS